MIFLNFLKVKHLFSISFPDVSVWNGLSSTSFSYTIVDDAPPVSSQKTYTELYKRINV